MKRRAAVLTGLSIVSFFALAYWGVSSASKQQTTTELSSVKRPPSSAQTIEKPAPTLQPTAAEPTAPETAAETHAAASPTEQANPEPTLEAAPEPTPSANAAPTEQAKAEPVQAEQVEPIADKAPPAPAVAVAVADKPTAPSAVADKQPPSQAEPIVAAKSAAAPAANSGSKLPQPLAAAVATKPAELPAPLHPRNPLLVVRALPEGSVRLWLDGQRMANPFDVRLPRDTKHKIEARGDGYESTSQTVRLESDAKLTFALRRIAPPPPAHPVPANAPAEHARNAEKHRGGGFVSVSPY